MTGQRKRVLGWPGRILLLASAALLLCMVTCLPFSWHEHTQTQACLTCLLNHQLPLLKPAAAAMPSPASRVTWVNFNAVSPAPAVNFVPSGSSRGPPA